MMPNDVLDLHWMQENGICLVGLCALGPSRALAATPTAEVPGETAGPYPGDGSTTTGLHERSAPRARR